MTLSEKLNKDGTPSVRLRKSNAPTLVKQIAASHSHELSLHLHGNPIEQPDKVVVPEEMATYAIFPY